MNKKSLFFLVMMLFCLNSIWVQPDSTQFNIISVPESQSMYELDYSVTKQVTQGTQINTFNPVTIESDDLMTDGTILSDQPAGIYGLRQDASTLELIQCDIMNIANAESIQEAITQDDTKYVYIRDDNPQPFTYISGAINGFSNIGDHMDISEILIDYVIIPRTNFGGSDEITNLTIQAKTNYGEYSIEYLIAPILTRDQQEKGTIHINSETSSTFMGKINQGQYVSGIIITVDAVDEGGLYSRLDIDVLCIKYTYAKYNANFEYIFSLQSMDYSDITSMAVNIDFLYVLPNTQCYCYNFNTNSYSLLGTTTQLGSEIVSVNINPSEFINMQYKLKLKIQNLNFDDITLPKSSKRINVDHVSIKIEENISPIVSIISPDTIQGNTTPQVVATITENHLHLVKMVFNGHEFDMISQNNQWIIDPSVFNLWSYYYAQLSSGSYSIEVVATDIFSNIGSDSQIVIKDATPPSVVPLHNPNEIYALPPNFSISVNDSNINNSSVQFSVLGQTYHMTQSLSNGTLFTFNASNSEYISWCNNWNAIPNGPYNIRFRASDILGNYNISDLIVIKDNIGPQIQVLYPDAIYYSDTPQIAIWVEDSYLNVSSISMMINQMRFPLISHPTIEDVFILEDIPEFILYWNNLQDGMYNLDFYAEDLGGIETRCSHSVVKDTHPSVITLLSGNLTTSSSPPIITISVSDEVSPIKSIQYIINSTYAIPIDTNLSITTSFTINSQEWRNQFDGYISILIRVEDMAGNFYESTILVVKDTTSPIIDVRFTSFIFYELSPTYEVWALESIKSLTYTFDDVIYYPAHGIFECWDDLPYGNNTVRFYGADLVGNIGCSTYQFVKLDSKPVLNAFIIENDNPLIAPSFVISVSSDLLDNIGYSIDNQTIIISDISGTIDQSIWNKLREGSVEITFFANSTYGRTATTTIVATKRLENDSLAEIEITPPLLGVLGLICVGSFCTMEIIRKIKKQPRNVGEVL